MIWTKAELHTENSAPRARTSLKPLYVLIKSHSVLHITWLFTTPVYLSLSEAFQSYLSIVSVEQWQKFVTVYDAESLILSENV